MGILADRAGRPTRPSAQNETARGAGNRGRYWLPLLLTHAVVIQIVTFVLRPTASYRALELGVPPVWLGALSGSFAVVPLVLALPTGRLTDRRGERPVMLVGAGLMLGSCVVFLTLSGSLAGLVVGSIVLGTGHLLSVVGEQAMVANGTATGRFDMAFGRYTFAASLGQTVGPGMIAALGGSGKFPDTHRIFVGTAAVCIVLVLVTLALGGASGRHVAATRATGSMRAVLRLPGLLRAVYASSIVLSAIDITLVYLPALGAERGLSSGLVGLLLLVRAASSMASRLCLGVLARVIGRRQLMMCSLAGGALTVGLMAVHLPTWLLTLDMALAGLALGVGQPLTMSWLAETAPSGLRGTAMALRLTGNRLGQVLVPSLVGLVAAGAGVAGVLGVSAVALCSAGAAARRFGTTPEDTPAAG